MKKIILPIAAMLLLVGCSNDTPAPVVTVTVTEQVGSPVFDQTLRDTWSDMTPQQRVDLCNAINVLGVDDMVMLLGEGFPEDAFDPDRARTYFLDMCSVQ